MPTGHHTASLADATTMAPYFARAMVAEGRWFLAMGVMPAELNRGIDLAVAAAVAELDRLAGSSGSAAPGRGLRDLVSEAINASGRKGGLDVDLRAGDGEAEEVRAWINRFADAAPGTIAAQKQRRVTDTLRALSGIHARLGSLQGATAGEDAGISVVLDALDEPLRQVVKHAGEEPAIILDRVLEGTGSFGVNTHTGEYGDLGAMGVLDWQGALRSGLQSAASVAEAILSTGYTATPKPGSVRVPSRTPPSRQR